MGFNSGFKGLNKNMVALGVGISSVTALQKKILQTLVIQKKKTGV